MTTTRTRCAQSERDEDFQRYLGGRMADAEHEAFELHYFECSDCYDALRDHQAICVVLVNDRRPPSAPARRPRTAKGVWIGLAIAGAAALAFWLLR